MTVTESKTQHYVSGGTGEGVRAREAGRRLGSHWTERPRVGNHVHGKGMPEGSREGSQGTQPAGQCHARSCHLRSAPTPRGESGKRDAGGRKPETRSARSMTQWGIVEQTTLRNTERKTSEELAG